MKGWYAKYNDGWHKIEDVVDSKKPAHETQGGNFYHLEGVDHKVHQSMIQDMKDMKDHAQTKHNKPKMSSLSKDDQIKGGLGDKTSKKDVDPKQLAMGIKVEMEHTNDPKIAEEIAIDHLTEDPKYYTKLKEVEKYDRVDEEADGKRELDYGKEELEKEPSKDSIKDRWNRLKKAMSVDSDQAIMPIGGDDDEEEEQPQEEQPQEEQPQEEQPQEEQPPEQADEQAEMPDESQQQEQEPTDEDDSEQQIIQALEEAGYSPAEIAHIVHGHTLPSATLEDTKIDSEQAKVQQDLEHKQKMHDLAYETAKQEQDVNGLDKDHKQRMLDLEYETAKKEKELELEFKRKELELKIELAKDKHEHSLKQKKVEVDSDRSRRQDASKTSQAEKEGR